MERSKLSFQTRQLIEGITNPFAKTAVNYSVNRINNMSEEELNEMIMSRLRRGMHRQCGRSKSEMLLTLATIHRREELLKARIASHNRGAGVKGNFDVKPIYI